MTLKFPTLAEQILQEYQATHKPISTLIKKLNVETLHHWDRIEHVFDDDSSLIIKGRGQNYSVTTELP